MNALEVIYQHRSIRKYKNEKIPDDILLNILKAATRAATNGNMQLYSIIITTDEEDKKSFNAITFQSRNGYRCTCIINFLCRSE